MSWLAAGLVLAAVAAGAGLAVHHVWELRARYRAYLVRYPSYRNAARGWPPLAFRAWVTVEHHPRRTSWEYPEATAAGRERYWRYVGNRELHIPPSRRWRLTKWCCRHLLWPLYGRCAVPGCPSAPHSLHHIWYGNLYRERWLWDFLALCWDHHTALHRYAEQTGRSLPVASSAYLDRAGEHQFD